MVDHRAWLAEFGDDTQIGHLSLPGTHNSAANYTSFPSVQCQERSVTDQLERGVRFLDVRVGKNTFKAGESAKELIVVHGKFPTRIPFPKKFKNILQEVYGFLTRNQTEFVIVSIKQEGTGRWDNDNDEFANLIWDKYVSPNKDKWCLGAALPLLRDARGKVFLFRRFGLRNEERNREFGLDASTWKFNTTKEDRTTFVVQDFSEVKSKGDIPKKVEYVKSLTEEAAQHNATSFDNKLFVNFASGSNFFNPACWPKPVARAMIKHKLQDSFCKACGLIIVDYADLEDWLLVKRLVDTNF